MSGESGRRNGAAPDGADRAVFGAIWGVAAVYQLFFVDPTESGMSNLQALYVLGWLIAVVGLGRATFLGTTTIITWAFIACAFGLAASVLDLGPIPDIARREILLHFGLGIVTAGFAARWSSGPEGGGPPHL